MRMDGLRPSMYRRITTRGDPHAHGWFAKRQVLRLASCRTIVVEQCPLRLPEKMRGASYPNNRIAHGASPARVTELPSLTGGLSRGL